MTKGGTLLIVAAVLLAGCGYESPSYEWRTIENACPEAREEVRLWQGREAAFRELETGVSLADITRTWGGASASEESVVDGRHVYALSYRRYVSDNGIVVPRPITTMTLVFVDGRLAEWHRF